MANCDALNVNSRVRFPAPPPTLRYKGMTKLYKALVYIFDHEDTKPEDIEYFLQGDKYQRRVIEEFQVADIGEWSDEHPANKQDCDYSVYKFEDVFEDV